MNLLSFLRKILSKGWKGTTFFSKDSNPVIIETSLDEIIFAHREKEYGAYMLRKNHNWYHGDGLGVCLFGFSICSFVAGVFGVDEGGCK